jgi:hypothetical protein
MKNISDFLLETDLHILQNDKFIDSLKEYMRKEKFQIVMINDLVLDVNSSSFRKCAPSDIVTELENCNFLYHFFVKYQYYNLAAAVRNNMYCILPKSHLSKKF